jgi:hypothetical protein
MDERWLARARELSESTVRWFWDDTIGGFFDTAHDAEPLIARPRELTDNAVPAGNSLAAELLLRLGDLMGNEEHIRRGKWVLESLGEPLSQYPSAFGHALGAAELAVHGATEVAIVGTQGEAGFEALARETASRYLPSLVLAAGPDLDGIPLLRDRGLMDDRATAYVCRAFVCNAPTTDPNTLGEQLEHAASEPR